MYHGHTPCELILPIPTRFYLTHPYLLFFYPSKEKQEKEVKKEKKKKRKKKWIIIK